MLNISKNSVSEKVHQGNYKSLDEVEARTSGRVLIRLLTAGFILFMIAMFLPWTQNIRARGNVTTIRPDQRPQTIHSIIAGRIEEWFVKEGDFVKRGDTILFISEINDEFFDPDLLPRTQEQLSAKELAAASYMEKVKALDNQVDALIYTSKLKQEQGRNTLRQAQLQVASDSIDLVAAQINLEVANTQYERFEELYEDGLKSLTEFENRKLVRQKAQADLIAAENDLLTSQNKVINARVELNSIQAQYRDEVAKAESEKYSAMSNMYDAEIAVTKLQNQYMNYSVRTGMYYITAPLDGYITKAIQSGIGETIKEGMQIISIMPANYDLAVEMFVRPFDLPLLQPGQKVRMQFDGWPAVVFSGWPNTSYGTYGGEIFAIDNFISDNGLFRVLIAPDQEDHPWPDAIRVGAGTDNMVLLNDVPVWYELWRQVNGFPPDYYQLDKIVKQVKE